MTVYQSHAPAQRPAGCPSCFAAKGHGRGCYVAQVLRVPTVEVQPQVKVVPQGQGVFHVLAQVPTSGAWVFQVRTYDRHSADHYANLIARGVIALRLTSR